MAPVFTSAVGRPIDPASIGPAAGRNFGGGSAGPNEISVLPLVLRRAFGSHGFHRPPIRLELVFRRTAWEGELQSSIRGEWARPHLHSSVGRLRL